MVELLGRRKGLKRIEIKFILFKCIRPCMTDIRDSNISILNCFSGIDVERVSCNKFVP